MMTYFETLSRFVPEVVEAGAPILINDVALIKDTVDNEILLRITMANSVEDAVIAVAVKIHMWDIFGDEVIVGTSPIMDYVYQDITFAPQSIYGNTVPIKMPDNVRRVDVKITRVVFSNGKVWKSIPENYVHVQAQDLLEGTDEFTDTLREEGEKYPPLLTYTDNNESWQCTCGGVNKASDETCYRCGRSKEYCKKEYSAEPIHNKFTAFMAEKERIAEEQRRIEEEKKRQEEEALRIKREAEAEAIRQRWAKEEEERKKREELEEIKRQQKKKWWRNFFIGILLGTVIFGGILVYIKIIKPSQMYKQAQQYMDEGNYEEAESIFVSLGGYKDSSDQGKLAKAEKLLQDVDSFIKNTDYQSAYNLLSDANEMIEKIPAELQGDLSSRSAERRKEIIYQSAKIFIDQKKYKNAIKNLKSTKGYKDSDELLIGTEYQYAVEQMEDKDYKKALSLLKDVGDYEDSIELYNECMSAVLEAGSIIEFGRYENDGNDTNGPDPIQWRVLNIKDDRVLIVSKAPVECMSFAKAGEFSWEESDVRKWLNADFYEGAFSDSERKRIMETVVKTGLKSGKVEKTRDHIFIPGKSTVENYLSESEWKWSKEDNTYLWIQYHHNQSNIYVSWLRNPSDTGVQRIMTLHSKAVVSTTGSFVLDARGVRPMMWIDFSDAAHKSKDGTVSYDISIANEADTTKKDDSASSEETTSSSESSSEKSSSYSSSSTASKSSRSSSSYSGSSSRPESSSSSYDSSASSSGYGYDPNDPYYSAADHDGDGKINDDEFQEAMGDAIDDLYALVGE